MGDHNGGAGRGTRGRNAAGGQGTPTMVPSILRLRDDRLAMRGLRPSITADNQLRLRHADWLNNANNPGRQRVLATRTTSDGTDAARYARDVVRGYRDGYNRPWTVNNARSRGGQGYVMGARAAVRDLWQQLVRDRRTDVRTAAR